MSSASQAIKSVKTGFYDRLFALRTGQGSLAGYSSDPYSFSGIPFANSGTILARRDDILIEEGGGGPRAIEKYMRLFHDSQIISAWEKLVGEIIQRKWEVFPASDSDKDEEVAEFVRQVIYRMGSNTKQAYGKDLLVSANSGFDNFIRGLSEALITGISVGEICWVRQGNYIVPSEIKMRDPRRFLFVMNEDGSVAPRLLTVSSAVEGIPLPLRSMVIHRHWAYSGFMDAYGSGLGRQLYSLVEFRRTLLSFWLQYADKHTTPTAVGKFPLGTPPEEVDSLFNALQRLGQETALAIPSEFEVDWLESQGRSEVYQKLIEYIDQQISFIINGENTVGQETGNTGSYARDQISDSVRMRKAKAFSEELDETLNATFIRWIVELNYPGAAIPRLRRNFDDLEQREDPVKIMQLLTQLQAIGYEVKDLDWMRDKLEIPSLSKKPQPTMGDMGGMDGGMGAQPAVMAEPKSPERMADQANGAMGSPLSDPNNPLGIFDLGEFDEVGDLTDKTKKDQLAKKIAQKFDSEPVSDVGFQHIVQGVDTEGRLKIDEYTSPGDIYHSIRRMLDEVNKISKIGTTESMLKSQYNNEFTPFRGKIEIEEKLSPEELEQLLDLYCKIYRLNRRAVHKECVILDPQSLGYWAYFAPYFI